LRKLKRFELALNEGRFPIRPFGTVAYKPPLLGSASSGRQIDQRQAGFFIVDAAEMSARFEDDHLKRRPDPPFQEMAAMSGAVGFANHHMRVKHWFAILFDDVASKGEDFDLFIYGNLPIALLLSIKEAKRDFTESANGPLPVLLEAHFQRRNELATLSLPHLYRILAR